MMRLSFQRGSGTSCNWATVGGPFFCARRPRFSALGSEYGLIMPPLEDGLAVYLAEATIKATTTHAKLAAPALT